MKGPTKNTSRMFVSGGGKAPKPSAKSHANGKGVAFGGVKNNPRPTPK